MFKLRKIITAVCAATFYLFSQAHAALVLQGTYSGNDSEATVNAIIAPDSVENLGRINVGSGDDAGVVPLSSFTLTNNGSDGSAVFDLNGTSYGLSHIVLKASNSYALFEWTMDPIVGMFNWNLAGILLNNGGQVPDLSHITFYGSVLSTSQVPLPAALPLFLSGIAGVGLMGRKKKKPA